MEFVSGRITGAVSRKVRRRPCTSRKSFAFRLGSTLTGEELVWNIAWARVGVAVAKRLEV
jgi:hypothetical protein